MNIDNFTNYIELDQAYINHKLNLLVQKEQDIINCYNSINNSVSDYQNQYDNYDQESNPAQYENLFNLKEYAKVSFDNYLSLNPWVIDNTLTKPIFEFTVEELAELDAEYLKDKKQLRDRLVTEITVTTSNSNTFDGDETAQTRMSRVIAILPDNITTVSWKLADNTTALVAKPEFQEALMLALQAQADLWFI